MEREEGAVAMAEGYSPDWGGDDDVQRWGPTRGWWYVGCDYTTAKQNMRWWDPDPEHAAERAEEAKRHNMAQAAQQMAADAWKAVDDVRRARKRLAEIEKEKVTWWRPEPICAVSCVSTLLKAPVGI